ncbi:MAG: hydantoinase/oxoprolinase family protein, partial [Alphaproteobacteria bacterium]
FAHGTTVVINTLTERKGAKTALITTRGFRDVLEIGRGNRPDLFNLRFRKPEPFVPRYLRREIDERTDHRGRVLRPVDNAALAAIIEELRAQGVEAIAVSFLHAYANPDNEIAAARQIREAWPELPVVASHQTIREWREYERTTTAVLSAYVSPIVSRYLASLEERLSSQGMNRTPFIMQSNGGVATVKTVRENPIAIVESGPASGVLGATALATALGRNNIIALDIGGTTAKCSLVADGKPRITTDYHIEQTRTFPGYPVKTAVLDIVEIGTGGGSIARIDEGGKLHVGPESAGANPGPVVYGRGGTEPTVSDAHVMTGRIDLARVFGREGLSDAAPVRRAFAALGERIGADAEEMARGVIRLADVNMEHALKLISLNKGHDPRDFVLVAYGGGGPLHGAALAAGLKIPEVVIPVNAPVFSAWGMLFTDLRRDYIQTRPFRLEDCDPQEVANAVTALEAHARDDFAADAIEDTRMVFERAADMRYKGQEHTVRVDLPAGAIDAHALADWTERFRAAHERLYHITLDVPAEVVNLHLTAYGVIERPALPLVAEGPAAPDAALRGTRRVDFGEAGATDARVYDRKGLSPGMEIVGPAAVEEQGSVTVIWPDQQARIDRHGNIVIRLEA